MNCSAKASIDLLLKRQTWGKIKMIRQILPLRHGTNDPVGKDAGGDKRWETPWMHTGNRPESRPRSAIAPVAQDVVDYHHPFFMRFLVDNTQT